MLSHTQRWNMTPGADIIYIQNITEPWMIKTRCDDQTWRDNCDNCDMLQVRAAALLFPGVAEAGCWCLTYFSSFPPIFHTVTSVTLSRCGSRVTHDTPANGQTHPEDAIIQTTGAHRAGKHGDLGSCDHCHAPDLSHHTAWHKHMMVIT